MDKDRKTLKLQLFFGWKNKLKYKIYLICKQKRKKKKNPGTPFQKK